MDEEIKDLDIDKDLFCKQCNAILVNGVCPNGCTLNTYLEVKNG